MYIKRFLFCCWFFLLCQRIRSASAPNKRNLLKPKPAPKLCSDYFISEPILFASITLLARWRGGLVETERYTTTKHLNFNTNYCCCLLCVVMSRRILRASAPKSKRLKQNQRTSDTVWLIRASLFRFVVVHQVVRCHRTKTQRADKRMPGRGKQNNNL